MNSKYQLIILFFYTDTQTIKTSNYIYTCKYAVQNTESTQICQFIEMIKKIKYYNVQGK